jgi:membrane protease YdiL (CAAX protease family)
MTGPTTPRPSAFRQPNGIRVLFGGHVFLFDKEPTPLSYDDSTGTRLLMIFAALEGLRLVVNYTRLSVVPVWLTSPLYLVVALWAVRRVAGVSLEQFGFIRWAQWNAAERSYFVQVILLVNIVLPLLFAARLRAALTNPTAFGMAFLSYLVYGFYQEVLYRGMLQTELVRRWGAIGGVLVSNVLYTFGPQHYQYFSSKASLAIPMFGSIFTIGLIFGLVFLRTRNLWIPAAMHAFGNAYVIGAFSRIR